jgi:hypothetical protein
VSFQQIIIKEDDGGPLLEGQICSWTIRLRNVGNAPASTTTSKTNFPWVNIESTSSSSSDRLSIEQLEAQVTPRCLGPNGMLITPPIQQGDSLKQPGAISLWLQWWSGSSHGHDTCTFACLGCLGIADLARYRSSIWCQSRYLASKI